MYNRLFARQIDFSRAQQTRISDVDVQRASASGSTHYAAETLLRDSPTACALSLSCPDVKNELVAIDCSTVDSIGYIAPIIWECTVRLDRRGSDITSVSTMVQLLCAVYIVSSFRFLLTASNLYLYCAAFLALDVLDGIHFDCGLSMPCSTFCKAPCGICCPSSNIGTSGCVLPFPPSDPWLRAQRAQELGEPCFGRI